MKKFPEITPFYTCVPNISITRCTVPEIRSETGRIFVILGHFLPFERPDNLEIKILKLKKNIQRYYNDTHLHHKWQSHDVWLVRYGAPQTEFFVILDKFLPFYPPMDPENPNFGKMNNTPEEIIILQMRTINDSHMMYGSWDMKCNRQKNWKKHLDIIILHMRIITGWSRKNHVEFLEVLVLGIIIHERCKTQFCGV